MVAEPFVRRLLRTKGGLMSQWGWILLGAFLGLVACTLWGVPHW